MEKSRHRGGRPPHKPDDKQRLIVELLASAAAPQADICRFLESDPKTLLRHYRPQLDIGAARVETRLVMHLHRLASGKDGVALRAIIFLLRARFGWSRYAPRRG